MKIWDRSRLYFECHITIEPVFGMDLIVVQSMVHPFGFRVADLLMQKRSEDEAERSKFDTFCTTRSKSYRDIHCRMLACVAMLEDGGFQVWRYKIENTLLDVRQGGPRK